MTTAPLPAWVTEPPRTGVHAPDGSYSPVTKTNVPRSTLPVYQRQLFPDRLIGEPVQYGHTIFESDGVRCWHTGDDIAIVSFKSRMHAIGDDVLDGVLQAIDEAERNYAALVIWQTEPPFSVGANLKKTPSGGGQSSKPSAAGALFKKFKRAAESAVLKAARTLNVADQLMAGKLAEVEHLVEQFQFTTQQLRYSMVPTCRRGGRVCVRRRLRIRHALRSRGGDSGKLHRARRSRRGPAARGRRLQGVCAARRAGRERRRCVSVPAPVFRSGGDGAGRPQRRARARNRLLAAGRPHRDEPLRAARDCQGGGPHAGRSRLSAAFEAARHSGARALGGRRRSRRTSPTCTRESSSRNTTI
jgi:hypothetical protein